MACFHGSKRLSIYSTEILKLLAIETPDGYSDKSDTRNYCKKSTATTGGRSCARKNGHLAQVAEHSAHRIG